MQYREPLKCLRNERGVTLLVSILVIAALVLLGATALMTTTTDLQISSNYRESARAFADAEAGADAAIAHLRTNKVTFPTAVASSSVINGGTCPTSVCTQFTVARPTGYAFNTTVNLYGVNLTSQVFVFRMTGHGTGNASKSIDVYIQREPLFPVGADGAVAMYGFLPQVKFKSGAGGGYNIDGHDYPIPGTWGCTGGGCSTTAGATGTTGVFTIQPLTTSGDVGAHLNGIPTQQMGLSPRGAEYDALVNYVLANNLYQTTLGGTRDDPAIMVVPNGSTLNGNTHCAGIIIVDDGGTLNLTGTFTFEGLVILRGTGNVFGAGTNNIFGTLVTVNHTNKLIDVTGSVNIFYSSAALSNLYNIYQLSNAKRVAWRDVM